MGLDTDKDDQNGVVEAIDKESQSQKKIPYPKSVFFIVSNEFCERFSYYGMRTILSLYLRDMLSFTESDSKVIYHSFAVLSYTFPLLGAIISDSWLGKFKTIMYLSIVYACGNVLLAVASANIGLPQTPFSIIALVIIALGTGGIKPCVAAFGGDQFVLPQQELQLAAFFSVFYFSINAGSLISSFLTPILREDVQCMDQKSCYPLAFGVPGILMIVSIIVFVIGRPMYKIVQPKGNILVEVCKCMTHAIKQKRKSDKKLDHWMDYAEEKYGAKLVNDIKITLKVCVLFIPLPIFWALYDQQGSGWTFQAARMDGVIGSYTILPDQMQVINAVLILVFIPLFTYGVYPLLAKCNFLTTPLQRMVCGGFLAAAAFGISVAISFALEANYPVLPESGQYQLRIFNAEDCTAEITASPYINKTLQVPPMGYLHLDGDVSIENYTITGSCGVNIIKKDAQMEGGSMYVYAIARNDFDVLEDDISKPEDGLPVVRTLVSAGGVFPLIYSNEDSSLTVDSNDTSLQPLDPGVYNINGSDTSLEFLMGGVYTVLINLDDSHNIKNITLYEITPPNTMHMLLLIPQYVVLTAAEIMFSITGLELSYSQAPGSMKAVLQSLFLLTTAAGNLIIVIIESIKMFDKQSYDFLLYTVLMLLDMVLLTFLASRYVYVTKEELSELSSTDETEETEEKKSEDVEEKTKF